MKAFAKTFWLVGAMTAGALGHHWLHGGAGVVKYLLMVMLFLTFLPLVADHRLLDWQHGKLLLAQVALALLLCLLLRPFGPILTAAGVMIALTPTATAAPVVTRLLGGNIGFVTTAVFLSNSAAALLLPLVLPFWAPSSAGGAVMIAGQVAANLGVVVLVPLLLALLLRRSWPTLAAKVARAQPASLYLWCAALVLISARATHLIATSSSALIAESALLSLLLCVVNFGVGQWLGGRRWRLECGQALGQKNTVLMIWICLSFLNPETALAPTFYVIWHNLANSYQLWRHAKAVA